MSPEFLGPFRIRRELGRGGMGSVFLAEAPSGQVVAIKVLHTSAASGERGRARFRREAEALSRLKHPRVVPILEVNFEDDAPYLVMPYVEGRSFLDLLCGVRHQDAGVLSFLGKTEEGQGGEAHWVLGGEDWVRMVARVGRDMAEALAVAHAQGIVHRDIKPANILIDVTGGAHLVDFGLALDERQALALTHSAERLGTPLYMSPEQISGGVVDHRSDIYSLGVSLIEALSAEAPLKARGLPELYRSITESDPLRELRSGGQAPQPFMGVLSGMVRRDARARYHDAGAVARDLGRFLMGQPVRPPRVGLWGWFRCLGPRARRGVALTFAGCVIFAAAFWVNRGGGDVSSPASAWLLEVEQKYGSGDFISASSALADALRRDPSSEEGRAWVPVLSRALQGLSEQGVHDFAFQAAADAAGARMRIDPTLEGETPRVRWTSPAYRTLEGIATRLLFDRSWSVRQNALEELGDDALELVVPPDDRERLLVRFLNEVVLDEQAPETALVRALELNGRFRCVGAREPARELTEDAARSSAVQVAAEILLDRCDDPLGRERLVVRAMGVGSEADVALVHLAERGGEVAVPVFVAAIESEDPVRRIHGAQGLAKSAGLSLDAAARQTVLSAVARAFYRMGAPAGAEDLIRAVGRFPDAASEPLLLDLARDRARPPSVRAAAVSELGRSGSPSALATLRESLAQDPEAEVRGAAALALRSESQASLLRAVLGDPEPQVRARALVALGRGRVQSAAPVALRILRDSGDLPARVGAIIALGLLAPSDQDTVRLLTELISPDRHPDERVSAAWALGRCSDPGILPALLSVLETEARRSEARARAQEMILRSGAGLFSLVGELAGLRGIWDGAAETLRLGLATADPAEAIIIAVSAQAARVPPAEAGHAIARLLVVAQEAERPSVQAAAIAALGRLPGSREATLPTLVRLMDEAAGRERRRALALAVTRLGRGDLGGRFLAEEPPRDGEDVLVRALILLRLRRDEEARDALLAAMRIGVLDRTRLALEPELGGFRLLADLFGL